MATLPGPGAGLRLGLLLGDGIGPEITPAAAGVMDAAMAAVGAPPIEWHELPMAGAAHGSAPDIAGQDVAHPIAMILSGGMLLDWLGTRHGDRRLAAAADRIDDIVRRVVDSGVRTRDLGGTASTSVFADAVVAELSR